MVAATAVTLNDGEGKVEEVDGESVLEARSRAGLEEVGRGEQGKPAAGLGAGQKQASDSVFPPLL
jgi:hypothetical protein